MDLLSTFSNLIIIVLGFSVLIFVHELGHFLAAKWAGIRTEGFAIGMGPVICSWRKGIGLTNGSTHRKVVHKSGLAAHQLSDTRLQELGIGETEYSLRWLPIGGFVKMLGQDDMRPAAATDHPRSYNCCPIGKRMVVVSAGVIMNIIFAAIFFIIAFMAGVRFEAPVIGVVESGMPAASALAVNADELRELGVDPVGIKSGDRVLLIDGDNAETFADLQIAGAMGREDQTINIRIERDGVDVPLEFEITPRKSRSTGLLSIGVWPASTTRLDPRADAPENDGVLELLGLAEHGITWGMRIDAVNGIPVQTLTDLSAAIDECDGQPVQLRWTPVDDEGENIGESIVMSEPVIPELQSYRIPVDGLDNTFQLERGLIGLTPLTAITSVVPTSPNIDAVREGDVIVRLGRLDGPQYHEVRSLIQASPGKTLDVKLLRDGELVDSSLVVNDQGKVGVYLGVDLEKTVVARPLASTNTFDEEGVSRNVATPVANAGIPAVAKIVSINNKPVTNWLQMRQAIIESLSNGPDDNALSITFEHPTPGHELETVSINISDADAVALSELGWNTGLNGGFFEGVMVTRSAGGSPLVALRMGVEETHKLIVMTYLTIDRLIRGSVGVEQLRGPVGIVHMGSQILDRGFMYLLFFLAMISVNLAVINFLPLPIVDGGLFLFLIYEKIKGRPPSIAFQNAATIVGLVFIGMAFLVVTWNDIGRIIGS